MSATSALKVVIATRIYTPEPAAASFRLSALAGALANKGHKVRVMTASLPGIDVGPNDPGARTGVRVERAPVLRDKTGYLRGYIPYLSFDIPLFFRLLWGVKGADAIVVEPPPTTGCVVRVVSKVLGIPYVAYCPDIWSDAAAQNAPMWVVRLLRLAESFTLRGAQRVIAVSEQMAHRARELGAKDVRLAINGIDTAVFSPQNAEKVDDPVFDSPFFLYAGTTSEWQGPDVFIRALSDPALKDAQLVFLGSGTVTDALKELALEIAPGRVHFRDKVTPEQAAYWQSRALACLVSIRPGFGYDYAYPTKVFSALSCGTPVVYAGPGPAREDIATENLGHLAEHTPESVAQALVSVLAAPADDDMRQRVRLWTIENHSIDVTGINAATIVEGIF